MRIEKSSSEQFTVVKLLNEKLDSRFSAELKTEFVNLNTAGAKNIIFNLGDVKYVDSSGLSAILTANRLCEGVGGILVLCGLNPHVEKLIKISHLETVLQILPTEQEAREAIFMHEIERSIPNEEEGEATEI